MLQRALNVEQIKYYSSKPLNLLRLGWAQTVLGTDPNNVEKRIDIKIFRIESAYVIDSIR